MAGAVSIAPTVFEEENTDGFDGDVNSPAILKLLHKLENGSVNFVPLSLKKKDMTTRNDRNTESNVHRWHGVNRDPHRS